MGKAIWQHSFFIQKSVDLYSQQDFTFKNSLVYAKQFERYRNAIVPNFCYIQEITHGGKTYPIFHAVLPVDIDISLCHKFLWSARHGDIMLEIQEPDTLEVFAVLTCIQRNQEQVKQGNMLYEEKVCDILFPGSWALKLWERYLCLWYRKTLVLQRNTKFPDGLLLVKHQNLHYVLQDFCATRFS